MKHMHIIALSFSIILCACCAFAVFLFYQSSQQLREISKIVNENLRMHQEQEKRRLRAERDIHEAGFAAKQYWDYEF